MQFVQLCYLCSRNLHIVKLEKLESCDFIILAE